MAILVTASKAQVGIKRLVEAHRRPTETEDECILRLMKRAIFLQAAIDEMAEKVESLWEPTP